MKKMAIVNAGETGIYVSLVSDGRIQKTIEAGIEPGSGLCPDNLRKVRQILRDEGIRTCPAATVLSDNECVYGTVSDESGDRGEIRRKLLDTIGSERISDSDEDYIFDCQPLAQPAQDGDYLCVAARRSVILDYKASFIRNNLRLDYLIPESVAIGNVIRNSKMSGQKSIFLDLNPHRTVIRAYRGDECVAHHEIESDPDDIDEQILRIRQTIDYYDENGITESGRSGVYVYGECAARKDIMGALKKNIRCSVYPVSRLFGGRIRSRDASLIFSAVGALYASGESI